MPRCSLNRKKYKLNDFSKWVIGTLTEKRMSRRELAEAIGIPRTTLTYRLDNNCLTYSDCLGIFKAFGADDKTILKWMRE